MKKNNVSELHRSAKRVADRIEDLHRRLRKCEAERLRIKRAIDKLMRDAIAQIRKG